MPVIDGTWALNRLVAAVIDAASFWLSMAGVTAASEAESATASSIALRFDDALKSTPMPTRVMTGTKVRANRAEKLPLLSERKRCNAWRFMVHLFADGQI